MGYLKNKSTLMIFDRHASWNINMEIENFGQEAIFVDIGKNEKTVREYIQNQLAEES